jgi:hypothetical protein
MTFTTREPFLTVRALQPVVSALDALGHFVELAKRQLVPLVPLRHQVIWRR